MKKERELVIQKLGKRKLSRMQQRQTRGLNTRRRG